MDVGINSVKYQLHRAPRHQSSICLSYHKSQDKCRLLNGKTTYNCLFPVHLIFEFQRRRRNKFANAQLFPFGIDSIDRSIVGNNNIWPVTIEIIELFSLSCSIKADAGEIGASLRSRIM